MPTHLTRESTPLAALNRRAGVAERGLMDTDARREHLRKTAVAYFDALRRKDFDLIPYAETVVLRAPLAPGGMNTTLHGREQLRTEWWAPLPGLLGEVRLLDTYTNDALTAVVGEAIIEILVDPPVTLYVADRFVVNDAGEIIDQVNHFDPRPLTNPTAAG